MGRQGNLMKESMNNQGTINWKIEEDNKEEPKKKNVQRRQK
jgi:hypothetical protein